MSLLNLLCGLGWIITVYSVNIAHYYTEGSDIPTLYPHVDKHDGKKGLGLPKNLHIHVSLSLNLKL